MHAHIPKMRSSDSVYVFFFIQPNLGRCLTNRIVVLYECIYKRASTRGTWKHFARHLQMTRFTDSVLHVIRGA